ncbi:MAG: FG-GAP-like repeat-containing protein, partial [Myxococcota bacterium]|nr:FG-GAP-like repeat-containing protein [Myxococcota bacterium]
MSGRLLLAVLVGCGGRPGDSASTLAPAPPESTTDDSAGPDTGPTATVACDKSTASPLEATTCVDAAACTWQGSQGYGYFGYAIATGADFDGDGLPDVAVGAPVEDVPDGAGGVIADGGRVAVLSGGRLDESSAGVLATFSGDVASAQVGNSLALPGDMDGDGLSELLVGARGESLGGFTNSGTVHLVRGRALGAEPVRLHATSRIYGESALARVGTTLAAPGDIDGDGLADALMQGELRVLTEEGEEAYGGGRAYVVRGGPDLPAELHLADADARLMATGTRDAVGLGLAGGDLDGDGYSDVVVGAPYAGNARGRVYLLPGGPGALRGDLALSAAPVQLSGTGPYDAFGWSVGVGDVTGDGHADLAIGAPLDDPGDTPNAGRVHLFAGGPTATGAAPDRLASWAGDFDEQQLGTGL